MKKPLLRFNQAKKAPMRRRPHFSPLVGSDVALETINQLNFGMAIIGPHRQALYINDAAKLILAESECLVFRRNIIRLRQPALEKWLVGQFRNYCPDDNERFIPDVDGQLVFSIRILPSTDPTGEHPLFTLSMSHSSSKVENVSKAFTMMFSLTSREAEVSELLVGGCTAQEIAGILGVNESTVRSHTKKIYHKTGVCRQTTLIRLGMLLFFR